MKRIMSVVAILFLLWSQVPVIVAYATDTSYVHGVTTGNSAYTNNDTPFVTFTNSAGTNVITSSLWTVHNGSGATKTFTVYFYQTITITWTSSGTFNKLIQLNFDYPTNTMVVNGGTITLGTAASGSATTTFYGSYASVGPVNDGASSTQFGMTVTSSGFSGGTQNIAASGSMSITRIDGNCDTNYQQQEIFEDNAIIDPLIETPVGSPTDNQKVTGVGIVDGTILRLQTTGGPWHDGTLDRFDTAFSYDGTTWFPIEDLVPGALCVVVDPVHPDLLTIIFTYAGHTGDFYIRVDDTAGAFANNTQISALMWSLASVVNVNATTCGDQFTYDPGTDLVVNGTLDAKLQSTTVSTALTIGEWYVLTTSGGPWLANEGGLNPDRYDMAAQNADGNWGTVGDAGWDASNCISADGNYRTVYFQADQTNLNLSVNDDHAGGEDAIFIWGNNTGTLGYTIYHAAFNRFPETCETLFDTTSSDLILSGRIPANLPNGVELQIPYDKSTQKPTDAGKDYGGGTQLPVRYFMIDISGGPWYDGLIPKWDVQINDGSELGWTDLKDYGGGMIQPKCAVLLDNYHYRVFFSASITNTYRLRVKDPVNYVDNTGFMLYEWSTVNVKQVEQSGPPEASACDARFAHNPAANGSIHFLATNSDGVYVPGLTLDSQDIAIETTDGPWLNNNTGASLYDVGISDDNGVTWQNIWQFNGTQCYEQYGDASHVMVFLSTARGHQYKVRVFDEDGNFAANTGSMGIRVYTTSVTNTMDQWTNCGDGYYALKLIEASDQNKLKASDVLLDIIPFLLDLGNPTGTAADAVNLLIDGALHVPGIPSANGQGVRVGGQLLAGDQYAIQIYGGPWYNDVTTDNPSFNVKMSADNAKTWVAPEALPGVLCVLRIGPHNSEGYVRVYFTAQGGANYWIRVDDSSMFLDNHGTMDYALFQVSQQDATLYSPGNIDAWAEACTTPPSPPTTPTPPSSSFDVPGWLGYLGYLVERIPQWITYSIAELKFFFLWCPEDTAALKTVPNIFADREPFATVYSIIDTLNAINDAGKALNWNNEFEPVSSFLNDQGGTEGMAPVNILQPVTDPNSFLNGGPLLLTEGGGSATYSTAYKGACEANMNPVIGTRFGPTICLTFAFIRENQIFMYWFSLLWDVAWILFFIVWIRYRINSVQQLLT